MNIRALMRCTLAFFATLLLSVSADAQLFRAYLAIDGNDTNPCTLPAPCRLLPAALNAVANGGEIWMLDSANYNTATVTVGKSVSILAVPGAVGSVLAISGPAINIALPGLKIALRNLAIVPLAGGGGTDGVHMTGASTLLIENSLIANVPGSGVLVVGTGKVKVTNTIIRNAGTYAVWLEDGAKGEISGTQMLANAYGVLAYGNTAAATTTLTVSDSVISQGMYVVLAYTKIAGANARITVTRCTIEDGTTALYSKTENVGSALITVSGSTITNNVQPWVQSGTGSAIKSLGNNHIQDNLSAGSGVLTPASLQ